jgi:repressor LexA
MTVGERIKKIRTEKNMQQIDLAIKCDISKQTLYKYENNIVTNIPLPTITKIAKALNVSESVIMGWEDEMEITDNIVEEHIELISLFEQLNDTQKTTILDMMRWIIKNEKGE